MRAYNADPKAITEQDDEREWALGELASLKRTLGQGPAGWTDLGKAVGQRFSEIAEAVLCKCPSGRVCSLPFKRLLNPVLESRNQVLAAKAAPSELL